MVIKKKPKQNTVSQPSPGNAMEERATSFSPRTPILRFPEEPFPPGAEVEVRIGASGFYNSWYEAKVLRHFVVTRWSKYKVQYDQLLSDDGSQQLQEDVYAKNVRPRAPRRLIAPDGGNEDEDPDFKMHDLVEAFHNDGWWHGVISGLRDPEMSLYTVSFPNSREVFQFKPGEIRHRLDFVNGEWFPFLGETQLFGLRDMDAKYGMSWYFAKHCSQTHIIGCKSKPVACETPPKRKKRTFKEGDNVEVSQLGQNDYGPSYFPARIEKVLHNSYYQVKYESPNARPNGDLIEILDPQHLRPAVDCIPGTNHFLVDSHVEFFHKGGWSPGFVHSCLSGNNYAVTVEYKGEEITKHFNVSNMRLRLDWDGRRWCKWGSPSKKKKRKPAHCSETVASDVKETTPDSVASSSKKLKKERSEEVEELQSGQDRVTLRKNLEPFLIKRKKELESVEEVPITMLFTVKSKLSKSTSSSGPRIMHAVRKVCQSRKLLTELKDCHSKISTGKRSSTCKRILNGRMAYKRQDEVNHDRQTTDKQTDVNLSNESSSNVPPPSTSGEKETACAGTVFCGQQQATNDTADPAGENAVGVSSHDGTMGHVVGSGNHCVLNTQDSLFDGVAEISKGELVNSQPLNSSAIMEHLSQSLDCISSPSRSTPVASVDQAALRPLSENSFLAGLDSKSKFDKHTLEENTPVKPVASDVLPFEKISPVWKTLETTLTVFSHIPQKPHFMKLKSECKDMREGTAIGMMVTYASMAESIQRLSVHTEVTVFEEKLACLDSLEENGFIVDPIRNRLQRLLEIKTSYTKSALKQVELETAHANKEQENLSMLASANVCDSKLNNIRKNIAELEENAIAILEEKAGILSSKEELQHDLKRLKEEISSVDRSHELSLEEFGLLISKPLSK